MISKAKLKFAKISPTKMRDVANLVKGKNVQKAQDILFNLNKKASKIIRKVLNSALSNAKNLNQETSNLYISKIIVNQGPFLKRHRAQAFGRAVVIRKRLSHLEIELDDLMLESVKPEVSVKKVKTVIPKLKKKTIDKKKTKIKVVRKKKKEK